MPRKIFILPYDPLWVESFNVEAKNLRSIFGAEIVEIHHIGSTSIPGMAAKPIVDVLPVVRDIHVIDRFNPIMREKGYLPRGEYGLPGRRYFNKGRINQRSHHIHLYQSGHGLYQGTGAVSLSLEAGDGKIKLSFYFTKSIQKDI